MRKISFYVDNDQYWDIATSFSNDQPFRIGEIIEVQLELIPFHLVYYKDKGEKILKQDLKKTITQFMGSITDSISLTGNIVTNIIILDCGIPIRLVSESLVSLSIGDYYGGFGCIMGILSFDKYSLRNTIKGKVIQIDSNDSKYTDLKNHLITIQVSSNYSQLDVINKVSLVI
jgi:hypothetical protein